MGIPETMFNEKLVDVYNFTSTVVHDILESQIKQTFENIQRCSPNNVIPDKPEATSDIATGKIFMLRPPIK